jgi:hypothetical protein
MPSDHPPHTSATFEYAERIVDGVMQVWWPDGKGWRECEHRTVEAEVKKLGLRKPPETAPA